MTNDAIITVENLSKRYKLGVIGATTLKESVERAWHRVRGRDPAVEMGKVGSHSPQRSQRTQREENEEPSTKHEAHNADTTELWALNDVSFEVKRGEVLGVIGRNGAGKSTLLKILTRITDPTEGRAILRGRVASLLEVGTGFHPELTGRENVYLNGAILGMKRAEITAKFDEIIAFAEVEKFVDTPVKRYSSGMYVRLAFAVAAHLEPEILLVDEVLAVGDVEFQKRCIGKMKDVAEGGRTVLFVSHNMDVINRLCENVCLLEKGQVSMIGESENVVREYLLAGGQIAGAWVNRDPLQNEVNFVRAEVQQESKKSCKVVSSSKDIQIEICYRLEKSFSNLSIVLQLKDSQDRLIFSSWDCDSNQSLLTFRDKGLYTSTIRIPANFLRPDRYMVTLAAQIHCVRIIDIKESVLSFEILNGTGPFKNVRKGVVRPLFNWNVYSA